VPHRRWFKSSYSLANGNCVEVQEQEDGAVRLRNSRHPDGPMLEFTQREWAMFLSQVRRGEFDGHAGIDLPPILRSRA
jgi:Domain of unknown function (DUF397)